MTYDDLASGTVRTALPVRPAARPDSLDTPPDLLELIDHLVDAIDAREIFEPDLLSGLAEATIRDMECELARRWGELGRPAPSATGRAFR